MRHRSAVLPASSVVALFLALVLAIMGLEPAQASEHSLSDHVVESHDGTELHVSVHKPAVADADSPAPVILHSHGWGGTRESSEGAFAAELDRGFGVVSFDQRGHGDTGGTAHVQDPDLEGRDVAAVIDFVADLDWVAKDTDENGHEVEDDPVLFAMGGSYGGGYQLVGALTEVRDRGATRLNALAPEITWFDLSESLAPQKVVRSAWVALLYAVGANMHHEDVHTSLAYGTATGQWPDGTVPGVPNLDERFRRNGPVSFVEEGIQLDIPVLIGQGTSDNLFNLNEGWHNFERTIAPAAREHSVFIAYNGGHALPNVLPRGYPFDLELGGIGDDACSPEGFAALRLDFFEAVVAGENPRDLLDGAAYSLTTADGACVQTEALDDYTSVDFGFDIQVTSGAMTTTGVGVPFHYEIAEGPLTVAGVPKLSMDVTSVGADQRVFFALSVGENLATAEVVQNNMMPLRELTPVVQAPRTVELPGVAVEVPEGENLYLTVSAISDMSFGHGSARTPGWVGMENLRVDLPTLD